MQWAPTTGAEGSDTNKLLISRSVSGPGPCFRARSALRLRWSRLTSSNVTTASSSARCGSGACVTPARTITTQDSQVNTNMSWVLDAALRHAVKGSLASILAATRLATIMSPLSSIACRGAPSCLARRPATAEPMNSGMAGISRI